jgi:hypothetical protein
MSSETCTCPGFSIFMNHTSTERREERSEPALLQLSTLRFAPNTSCANSHHSYQVLMLAPMPQLHTAAWACMRAVMCVYVCARVYLCVCLCVCAHTCLHVYVPMTCKYPLAGAPADVNAPQLNPRSCLLLCDMPTIPAPIP